MTAPRKVLITGATGFIGGRLTEVLMLSGRAQVRALVRSFSSASRIARFPVQMIRGGLADAEALGEAVKGCEVVYHCAYDWQDPEANVRAAKALGEACLEHGVKRLVHLSTLSVYEPLPDGPIDESTPAEPCGDPYTDTKIAVERALLELVPKGLPVAILQPTIVYGPYSVPWTLTPARRIRKGALFLPAGGQGLCNPVYVDDVIWAMLLAADRPEAVGERLLISDGQPVTWRRFFGAYEQMLGERGVVCMPDPLLRLGARGFQALKGVLRMAKPAIKRAASGAPKDALATGLRSRRGDLVIGAIKRAFPPIPYVPSPQQLALYRARPTVSIDKARRVLGWEPRYDFDRGMQMTEAFIRWSQI